MCNFNYTHVLLCRVVQVNVVYCLAATNGFDKILTPLRSAINMKERHTKMGEREREGGREGGRREREERAVVSPKAWDLPLVIVIHDLLWLNTNDLICNTSYKLASQVYNSMLNLSVRFK